MIPKKYTEQLAGPYLACEVRAEDLPRTGREGFSAPPLVVNRPGVPKSSRMRLRGGRTYLSGSFKPKETKLTFKLLDLPKLLP